MREKLKEIIKYLKEMKNPKFLYRIISTGNNNQGYQYMFQEYIGQKYWFIPQWKDISQSNDISSLKEEMRWTAVNRSKNPIIPKPKPNKIIALYTCEDLIVDLLKDNT